MDVWTGPNWYVQTGTVVRDFQIKSFGPWSEIFPTGPRRFSPYFQEIDLTNNGPTITRPWNPDLLF